MVGAIYGMEDSCAALFHISSQWAVMRKGMSQKIESFKAEADLQVS